MQPAQESLPDESEEEESARADRGNQPSRAHAGASQRERRSRRGDPTAPREAASEDEDEINQVTSLPFLQGVRSMGLEIAGVACLVSHKGDLL